MIIVRVCQPTYATRLTTESKNAPLNCQSDCKRTSTVELSITVLSLAFPNTRSVQINLPVSCQVLLFSGFLIRLLFIILLIFYLLFYFGYYYLIILSSNLHFDSVLQLFVCMASREFETLNEKLNFHLRSQTHNLFNLFVSHQVLVFSGFLAF